MTLTPLQRNRIYRKAQDVAVETSSSEFRSFVNGTRKKRKANKIKEMPPKEKLSTCGNLDPVSSLSLECGEKTFARRVILRNGGVVQKICIKPLSVNECWMGRRFKTPTYKSYEIEVLYALKKMKIPPPPYHIIYIFGMSNLQSDVDNPVKPFQDILQNKYRFNDRDVYKISVEKVKVKKGCEYIEFGIETYKKS